MIPNNPDQAALEQLISSNAQRTQRAEAMARNDPTPQLEQEFEEEPIVQVVEPSPAPTQAPAAQAKAPVAAPTGIGDYANKYVTNQIDEGTEFYYETAVDADRVEVEHVLQQNPNVHVEFPYTSTPQNKPLDIYNNGVALLAERVNQANSERIDDMFVSDSKPKTVNYAVTLDTAQKVSYMPHGMFEAALDRPGSNWKQYLNSERGKLSFSAPRVAEADVKKVKGRKAMSRARAIMGLGGIVSIPLFRSGFWITIEAPKESSLIELNRRIAEEKIAMGRQTHGLVFSNNESFLTGWLVDFALEHIYETNLKDENDLRSKIKAPDYHAILQGLALLIHPRGFNYTRSVTTNEGVKTRKLLTALINISKIFWVDNSYFSEAQVSHMAMRQPGSISNEMLENYQKTIRLGEGRDVVVAPGITVTLKVPSIDEQVASTHKWVTDLNQVIDETFTQTTPDEDDRNRMLAIHSRASQARTYGSWIQSIQVEDEESIDDEENISEMLTTFSQSEAVTSALIEGIKTFINDVTCTVVAIPESDGSEGDELPRFPQLIPINVASVFFILLVQSVSRTTRKKLLV